MSDIAKLGFSVDTSHLKKGERALDSFASTGEKTEKRTTKAAQKINGGFSDIERAMGKSAVEAMKVNSAYDKVSLSLERQALKIKGGAKAVREFDVAQKLGLKTFEQVPRAIQKQVDQLIDLERAERRATAQAKDLNKTIGNTSVKMTKTSNVISRSSKKIDSDFQRINKSASTTSKILTGLVGIFALIGVQQAAADVVGYSDAWKNVNSQLRQVTDSESDLINTRSKLLGITRDTRSELSNTVNLYAEMTRGTSELNISSGRLMGVTKTLNNLFLAGGKPISETIGAIRQLNQGFASGVLRGDEFNSVAEGAPKVLDALTLSLGVTRGELRDFAATGGITAKIMIDALEGYSTKAAELASKVEMTFGQSILVAKTNMTEFVGQATLLNAVIGGVGGSIIGFSENLDALSTASAAFIGVIALGLVPTIVAYTAKQYGLIASQLLLNTTTVTTSNVMGVMTVRMATATIATNALAIATRFLLSPLGLITAAIGVATAVFFAYKKSTTELTAETTALKTEVVENISVFDEYVRKTNALKNANLSGLGLTSLQDQFNKSTSLVKTYTERLENLEEVNASSARKSALLLKLNAERSALEKITTLMPQAVEGYTKLTSAEQNLVDKLDPLSAASRKLEANQVSLTKAHERGAISVSELLELNNLLQKGYDKTIEKADPTQESFNKLTTSLANQTAELSLSADAFELYSAKMALGINATPAMIASVDAQITAIQRLRKAQKLKDDEEKKIKKLSEDNSMENLTKDVDDFGGAWTRAGSAIVDAFGDISDSISDYISRTTSLDKLQSKINDKRKEEGADLIALNKLQAKVNHNRTMSELGGIKSISSATGSLFDEKTAAAKSFAALNKIITIAEIALSFQKMAAGTVETGVHVANETTKQGANALTAITSAFAAPFPVGPIAGVAMIATMASLLGGFAGGGSVTDPTETRQANQGTGSLLGSDDKSASIIDSQERFEDLQLDQLSELRGIRSSMTALSDGINKLAASVSVGGGKFTGDLSGSGGDITSVLLGGIFGSTKKKIIDEGISFVSQSLGGIIDGGILEARSFFDIEKTKKKLFGLSKSTSSSTEFQALDVGIEKQMGDIFSHIGDVVLQSADSLGFKTVGVLSKSVMSSIDDPDSFNDIRKGISNKLSEAFTLTETDLETALSGFKVDIGKVSLEGLNGEEIEKELQAVFSKQADLIAEFLVPSIAEYQKIGEGLFDTLTRVTKEQSVFNSNIERMGFDLSALSNVIQIDVAQSIIGLTGGLENFSELSGSFFESFFSEAEQFEFLQSSITSAFDSLGLSVVSSREEFKLLVQSVDLTTEAGQKMYASLLELSPAMSDFIGGLEDAAKSAFSMLEKSINLEKSRAKAVLDVAKTAHSTELDRIKGIRSALSAESELRKSNLSDAQDGLNNAFGAEMSLIQSISDARISSLGEEKSAIGETVSSMKALINSINSPMAASVGLLDALSSAKNGDFSVAKELDFASLLNLDAGTFSSASEMSVQQALNANRLKEIGELASTQLSESELALAAVNEQIELTRTNSELELSAMQSQLDSLLGIDNSVLSVADAVNAFSESQSELNSLNYEQEQSKLDLLVSSATDVMEVHQKYYDDEISRFDDILTANESLLSAALGIDDSVLSVAESVESLALAIAGISSSTAGIATQTLSGKTIPPPPQTFSGRSESSEAVELKGMRRELEVDREFNKAALLATAKNTKSMANTLQRFEIDGMDTRSIV